MKKKYLTYFLIFIIFAMASGALTYSILHLMKAHQDYEDSRDVYEELEDDFIEHPDTQDESQPDTNDGKYEYLQIDFDGLRKVNPDVIAWIDIPGAGISYPVLQGEDNSYYLTHLASGQFGISGSIFMDYHNRPDFSDQNTIIYGHNMKNGTMFSDLKRYVDRDFLNAHRTVKFETADGVQTFIVTEALKTNTSDTWYKRIAAEDGRQLILSTCYGSGKDGRLLIIAAES